MQITALADSGKFDVIIIDAAPTGSTLQLLSFPDMARWYLEKIFPFQRKTIQLARPVMKRMTDIPIPDEDVFDSIEELVNNLERTSQLLSNFYQALEQGQPIGQALRKAKLQYLNDKGIRATMQSPYFWAGLSMVGDDRVVAAGGQGAWWYWGLGLLVLVLGYLWAKKNHLPVVSLLVDLTGSASGPGFAGPAARPQLDPLGLRLAFRLVSGFRSRQI